MKNIFFFGGASLLSNIWAEYWKKNFNIYLGLNQTWVEKPGLKSVKLSSDLSNYKKVLSELKIDLLINFSGLTSVEECENNYQLAEEINSILPQRLSLICLELKIKFIHISTDHLFDGKERFYSEHSKLNTLNKYASTKAKGEKNVLQSNPESLIIRTNFFGKSNIKKQSFSDFIISKLKDKQKIFLFSDVYYTPIFIEDLTNSVLLLIKKNKNGIYNVVSDERISKYDFGIIIAEVFNFSKKLIVKDKLSKRKDLVVRPLDMSLSNKKIKEELEINFNSITNQIRQLKKLYKI